MMGLIASVAKSRLLAGCALCALFAQQTLAQGTAAKTIPPPQGSAVAPDAVQEIIVTAQKRSERLSDVPISITAATGEQLQKQGITTPADLSNIVPGLTFQKSTFGVPVFTIRGIGLYDTSIGIAPTVSVYVDQTPLPYLAMTQAAALDIDRVEVLKGPQGTLFGQNSTGGAINYIAAKPTATPEAGFDLTYGRFNQLDEQGFVSGPITDTLSVRVAFRHEGQDGWQESQSRPGDKLGSRDFTDGRILVDWRPTDRLKFELNVNGWVDHSETQAAQFLAFRASRPAAAGGYTEAVAAIGNLAAAPDNARAADWDPGVSFHRHDNQLQVSGRADWQVSDQVTLTSISAYANYKTLAPVDSDGTSFDDFRQTTDGHINTISQELRAAVDLGRTKLTVGANYEKDHTAETDRENYMGTNSGLGPIRYFDFSNIANQQVNTYAAFADGEFTILPTLTAQLGARYTKQDRDFEGCLADAGDGELAAAIALLPALAGLPYAPAPNGACVSYNAATLARLPVVDKSLNQSNVSWRAGLNWKPMAETLVYANVTRGYKAGAFTPLPAIFSSQLNPVTQEEVTAYELGVKKTMFERKLDLTAAGFYYDYANKQVLGSEVFPEFGPLPALQNIPKSDVVGAEVDLTLHPIRGLSITAGATYVKSKVDDHFTSSDPLGNLLDLKGEAFPNTPNWQANGDVEYDFPVSHRLSGFIGGNISYRSASNAAFGDNPTFRFKSYSLVGLRAGLGSEDGRWRVEVWGRNIFNAFYWTNVDYYVDSIARTTGMPDTYGVTLHTRL